jgi:hypothetical protein
MASIGLAAIIIHEPIINDSEKKDLASLIFLLFNVDKYLYVTKKLAELTIEALIAKKTPIKPTSIRPIAVNLDLDENGVTIAHPGNKSLAFLSIECISVSSFVNLLYKLFWCLDISNLHLHASLENFNCLQLAKTLCWVEELVSNFWNF